MGGMMGPSASDAMHIYLGKRYLGVSASPSSRYDQLYGLMGGMMSGYRGSALAGMMGTYLNGQGKAAYTMGPGMMGHARGSIAASSSGRGWPTGAIVGVAVLGAILIAGAAALAVPRVRKRSRSGAAATS